VDNGSTASGQGTIGSVAGLGDAALKALEGLASAELAVSVVVADADIDIQAGRSISSRNFTALPARIRRRAPARPWPSSSAGRPASSWPTPT
jgi:hypothetical protein